ncbi:MAG: 23S rRNA (guanosine(2251)-2'-O)-methyltransferase RlmB [Clostridia bacterium]|nr:23S rRNA (guanosine(2251)-2'-O)-methyltransferase RlmB [Clostridia bacterium]
MIIFGKNAIVESLRAEKAIYKIFVLDKFQDKTGEVEAIARRKNIKLQYMTRDDLTKLCGDSHHQGFVAECADFNYSELDEIMDYASSKGEQPFLVILDGIEDPHNLGSIIRVCECAGVHGVIIPKHNACPINSTVAKTSAGALSNMRVCKVTNLTQTVQKLQESGVWVYAVELGGVNIYQQNLKGALALIIGSEGDGVGQLLKKKCDGVLTMPMKGNINSLNASVACGVAVFEAVRQRS